MFLSCSIEPFQFSNTALQLKLILMCVCVWRGGGAHFSTTHLLLAADLLECLCSGLELEVSLVKVGK